MDADQQRMLLAAADPTRSTQSSIVALQSGVETGKPTRTHVERSVVTIIDTPEGRLVAEQVPSAGKKWMVIAPGSATNIVPRSTTWCGGCQPTKNGFPTERLCK